MNIYDFIKSPVGLYSIGFFTVWGLDKGVKLTMHASRSIKETINKKREETIKFEKLVPDYLIDYVVVMN